MVNLYQSQSIQGWPYHVSAGGVVFRNEGTRQFAILYRDKHWHGEESWHLPKGTLENGETLLECATREVEEETGLRGKLWGYLGSINRNEKYSDSNAEYEKTTHYFLFEYNSGDGSKMDKEHDSLEWLTAREAYEKLAHGRTGKIKSEQQIIDRAEHFLKIVIKPPKYD